MLSPAAAKEMRSRTPGMIRDPLQLPHGIDPRKCLRGCQLPRRYGREGGGAVVLLEGTEFANRAFRLGQRCANLGRNAPADGSGPLAEGGFLCDRATRSSARRSWPFGRARRRVDRA